MKSILVLTALAIFLSGCAAIGATTRTQLYDEGIDLPATDPGIIDILSKKPQSGEFIAIGEIIVDGVKNMRQAYRIFRIKAAEFGCDAVYISGIKEKVYRDIRPHYPHFSYGYLHPYSRHYGYSHYGYYRHRGHYGHRYRYHYPHRYYYCYGCGTYVDEVTLMTVTGIAIKYSDKDAAAEPEPKR